MKKSFIAIVATIVPIVAMAATPIEPSSAIDKKLTPQIIESLAGAVRIRGYSCDSITVARFFISGSGYVLVCNNGRYEYEIEDKGGNIVVTVK